MDNAAMSKSLEMDPSPPGQRRRLLGNALAITVGGGIGALAPVDAVAQAGPATKAAPASSTTSRRARNASPMQENIDACVACHGMCYRMAMTFCLEKGGRHAAPKHLGLMLNCADLCQTSANFMLSDSPMHGRVCLICAEACEACAKSCEEVGDMRDCVEECLNCAKSCRSMT